MSLCFEKGSAAAALPPVLFGVKQQRVLVGHFGCSSSVAVCQEQDESQAGYMPCPRECELEGRLEDYW